MYNRYLAAAEQTAPETSEPPQSSTFSGLGRTLNARRRVSGWIWIL